MFEIDELKVNKPSVYRGSSALQALQNDHTFILDLLVRESIQNSSDAALEGAPVFRVLYKTGVFENQRLTVYFDKQTEQRLNARYSPTCSYLEIRDNNTEGLTGETRQSLRNNSTKSNFIRLIFDMGDGQDRVNAGGNWGYGKTVYYRLGNGIVIYYSRIKVEEGKYESRLLMTIVENEKDENALLRTEENVSAGRAWWGEWKDEDLIPIVDEGIIADFLNVFGIEPFGEEETGTSIIIPYIDEDELVKEGKSGFKVDEALLDRCSFLNSVPAYLKYAIQKWYAPVVNNSGLRAYGKKFLNAYVNDELIGQEDMYPIFRLVQDLYTTAYAKFISKSYESPYPIICKESVGHYRRHPYHLGYTAFAKMNLRDLQGEELLLPPNVYMNLSDKDYNGVVTLYTRDLGMVLNYEESWVNSREFSVSPEEVLVAFYVPAIEAEITVADESFILGEYLRQREEADHMKWDDDPAKMKAKCVGQIKVTVDDAVRRHFNPEQFEPPVESNVSEFAGVLGEKLFPRKKAKPKKPGLGGSGGDVIKREKTFAFQTNNITITTEGHIKVLFDLELKEKTTVAIKTKVSSTVAVDAEKWKNKIGTSYPLQVTNLVINSQEQDSPIHVVEKDCELIVSGLRNKISGSFEIVASDKKLTFGIDCEEKKEEDN